MIPYTIAGLNATTCLVPVELAGALELVAVPDTLAVACPVSVGGDGVARFEEVPGDKANDVLADELDAKVTPADPPAAASLLAPAVIVTDMKSISVPVYVVVEEPGGFAALPPLDSAQIARVVPKAVQSCVSRKSSTLMQILYVLGPTVNVWAGAKPQSAPSVPETQFKWSVVT